jgi:hypothetical protein
MEAPGLQLLLVLLKEDATWATVLVDDHQTRL